MIYFYCSEVHQGCFHRLGLCSSGRGRLLLVPEGTGKGEITSLFLHTLHPPRSSKAFHFRDSLAHRSSLQMTLTPAVPMKVGPLDCKENKSEVVPIIGSFHPVSRSSSLQLAAAVDHTRFITRRCQTFHLGLPEVTLLGRLVGLDTQNSCLGTL